MESILIVCTGNICRSPMAEGYLKEYLSGIKVESAGVDAVVGSGADKFAKSVMADVGIDIEAHRARQFESWMCKAYDLILVLDRSQREYIERASPFSRGRIFPFEKEGGEIEDPFRGGIDKFRRVYTEIERSGAFWLNRLEQLCTASVRG
ncbi:protein-tyrosine phosphatase [Paraburkholderia sp. BL6669N2]|uniref:low molecular weight protein-tyrosine-phosphatase n=1 Tax=Paraburkholderia sp. BL6669N2 TaxID=1938807 RepID=UPI000E22C5BD|nr:low molecular weight protein-tyrosine-phosphatase [Paraburkholderia sp. BL6669N2]REG45616.1 protein-tyrosine phosphatase [Paraburkholderia sp. BL6669N2]